VHLIIIASLRRVYRQFLCRLLFQANDFLFELLIHNPFKESVTQEEMDNLDPCKNNFDCDVKLGWLKVV
jgi:hypothetical protein